MTRALSPRTFPPGGWASLLSRKGGGVRVPGGSSCERRGRVLVRDASIAVSWSGSALTGVYPPLLSIARRGASPVLRTGVSGIPPLSRATHFGASTNS